MRVLLTNLDETVQTKLASVLGDHGFEVVVAAEAARGRSELRLRDFDVVLCGSPEGSRDLVRLAGPAAVGLVGNHGLSHEELASRGLAFSLTAPVRTEHVLAKLAASLNLPPMTSGQRAAIEAYFEGLERGDWERLAATCTPDVLYHLPTDDGRFGRTIAGRGAFREFAAQTFGEFKEPRFELESVRALPRGASVRYHGSWLAADGTRHSMPGAVLFVFDHDLIREIGVRLDVNALHESA